MAKSFIAPKTRLPRSSSTDAAKLEAKRQFAILTQQSDDLQRTESLTIEEEVEHKQASVKTATEISLAKSMEVSEIINPTETRVAAEEDKVKSSPLASDSKDDDLQNEAEIIPRLKEEQPKPTQADQQLLTSPLPHEISTFPSYSPARLADERSFLNDQRTSTRKQLSVYPTEDVMNRLEMIRIREKIGSAMIIEEALREYLARYSDQDIVARMRAQGHRLRRAKKERS